MIIKQSSSLKFCACCISFVVIVFFAGCGSGGAGKNPNDVDNDGDGVTVNEGDCNDADAGIYPGASEICGDGIDQDCNGADLVCPVVTGQALLGPLTGAAVEVYHYYDLNTSIYSTITSESIKITDAGLFDIPESVIEDNELYVIKISGGKDIDIDDDGVIDDVPTDNLGTLHIVVTSAQLKAGSFKANILTDITYHKVIYLILAKYSKETILQELELYSKRLLHYDVNGDGDKNPDDLLQWNPVYDKDKVSYEWSFFENCIAGIHDNIPYSEELSTIHRSIVGGVFTPGFAKDVTVSGNYAYIADSDSGLQVIDVSIPANPTIVGTIVLPGVVRNVTFSGNYAYVVVHPSGFQVIDFSNPANPTIVGAVDTPEYADAVTVSGDYVYVKSSHSGLTVYRAIPNE